MNQDRDLRQRFAALRAEEEASLPSFSRLAVRRKGVSDSRRVRRWVLAAGTAALVVAAAVAWLIRPPAPPEWDAAAAAREVLAWQAETDFLLETPQAELYSAMPALGLEAIEESE